MSSKEGGGQMPDRPIDIPDPEIPDLPDPDNLASKEVAAFEKRRGWSLRSIQVERWLDIILKTVLFIIVIAMNIWWTHRVLQLVWKSADSKSDYHLANSVLIALVTTSLANFLTLVAIVARYLFPDPRSSRDPKK
jgi:hypothetical protein